MVPNPQPYIDNLTDFGNDTFYKSLSVFSDAIGLQMFWTIIFVGFGIALAISSKYNMTVLLAYFLAVNLLMIYLLLPVAVVIFAVINALIASIIFFRSFVLKR